MCILCRGLLNQVDVQCINQIKLLFDSIDANGDGHLSVQELTAFASGLGYGMKYLYYILFSENLSV